MTEIEKGEMRVKIAADVIRQTEADTYLVTHNEYVLQESNDSKCKVCALGSLILSKKLLKNKNYIVDNNGFHYKYNSWNKVSNELEEIFDEEMMFLIEAAYEGYDASDISDELEFDYTDDFYDEYFAAVNYSSKIFPLFRREIEDHDDLCNDDSPGNLPSVHSKALLQSIMINIIMNDGTFNPKHVVNATEFMKYFPKALNGDY